MSDKKTKEMDPEVRAIQRIQRILGELEPVAGKRVAAYVSERADRRVYESWERPQLPGIVQGLATSDAPDQLIAKRA